MEEKWKLISLYNPYRENLQERSYCKSSSREFSFPQKPCKIKEAICFLYLDEGIKTQTSQASSLPKTTQFIKESKTCLKLQQKPFDCTLCSGDSDMRYSGSFLLSLVLFKIRWHSPGEQLEGRWEWCAVSWGIQGNIFIFRIKVENMCQKAPSEVVLLLCVLAFWMKLRTYWWGQGDSIL